MSHSPARILVCGVLLGLTLAAPAARPGTASAAAPGAGAASWVPDGFENVSAAGGAARSVAYENRRWRHSAEALGRLAAAAPADSDAHEPPADGTIGPRPPFLAFERRLGLIAASITPPPRGPAAPRGFAVRYPSDPDFPRPPAGPVERRTFWRPDLELQPLLTYELGRVLDPVLVRIALAPRLRVNPWPGAMATASIELPVRNDFESDPNHPDLDQVRPGQLTLDQFAWLPRTALASASAGYFGDNRWGISFGAARPLAEGALLLDAQADLTGFVSFGPGQLEYSDPTFWSGYGGVVVRVPFRDVALRVHAARWLGGDRGVEVEVRRSMGDLDLGVVGFRTGGVNMLGVRLGLPLPPMTRAAGAPVRFQLADRWPFEHRSQSGGLAEPLRGVASREDFLRQLSRPALEANAERYALADGPRVDWLAHGAQDWLSWSGMTGFVNTPWAGVEGERQFEAGYAQVPARWAYDQRKLHDNQIYSVTVGFLPHVEGSLRATAFPGLRSFGEFVPGSRLTDTDEMVSGRIELLAPRPGRPGLALGVEDLEGTRRFNASYAVAGLPWRLGSMSGRVTGGYAPRVLKAVRHTLDGGFGAFEVSPIPDVALQAEYDTEKWNAAAAARLPFGLRVRAALLGMTHASFGGSFHFAL